MTAYDSSTFQRSKGEICRQLSAASTTAPSYASAGRFALHETGGAQVVPDFVVGATSPTVV